MYLRAPLFLLSFAYCHCFLNHLPVVARRDCIGNGQTRTLKIAPVWEQEFVAKKDNLEQMRKIQNAFYMERTSSVNLLGVIEAIQLDKIYPLIGQCEYRDLPLPDRDKEDWSDALDTHNSFTNDHISRITYLSKFYADYCASQQSARKDTLSLGDLVLQLYNRLIQVKLKSAVDEIIDIPYNMLDEVQVRHAAPRLRTFPTHSFWHSFTGETGNRNVRGAVASA